MTFSLHWVPRSSLVVAPAAMMQSSNVTVSVAPSLVATSIVLASLNVPQPWISWILFFFIR